MKKIVALTGVLLVVLGFLSPVNGAINSSHPRIFLTNSTLSRLIGYANSNTPQWQRLLDFVNPSNNYYSPPDEKMLANALVYKIKNARGDVDAADYATVAINTAFESVIWGTSTALEARKLTDSTKDWVNESSQWAAKTLETKQYYLINPNINQDQYGYINRGYLCDTFGEASCPTHTDTEYYVHPNPAALGEVGAAINFDMTTVATPGDIYVIFPGNPDAIKDKVLGVALVYDWCYELLTVQQRQIIAAWLWNCSQFMMTSYYGLDNFSWINYTLDFLSGISAAGYAIWGDSPKGQVLLDYVHSRYTASVKESLLWVGQGGGWAEGDGYGASIYHRLPEFFWICKTAGGIDYFSEMEDVLKGRLQYALLDHYPVVKNSSSGSIPYREVVANGDGARAWETASDYMRKAVLSIIAAFPDTLEAKTAQTFFTTDVTRPIFPFMAGWEFLFYIPDQPTLPLEGNAPLANLAINAGMVQMRSSWSGNTDTLAQFKSGPKIMYHSHLDANTFSIFKYSDLAPDTGNYAGAGSEHGAQYFARTIAHNAMILYDSNEDSWENIQGVSYLNLANDGGQREVRVYNPDGSEDISKRGSWQTSGYKSGDDPFWGNEETYQHGQIVKYDNDDSFVYTVGDATNGYDGNTHKADSVIRKFFYLRPDIFVIYDKVATKNETIEKNFVLHSVDSMEVSGTETIEVPGAEYSYSGADLVTITNGPGRLFSRTILPENVSIRKIGGRGLRDFWVDGANRAPGGTPYGLWRAEIRPTSPSIYDEFLTVMYATSSSTNTMPDSSLITSTSNEMKGVSVNGDTYNTIIMFSGKQDDSAPLNDIIFPATGNNIIMVDLQASTTYYYALEGSNIIVSKNYMQDSQLITSSASGSVHFSLDVLPRPVINSIRIN